MVNSLHNFIRANSLQSTLRGMVEYAEIQAQLYSAFGDQEKFVHWVKIWAHLLQATDNITTGLDSEDSLELWSQYLCWETHDESEI